jgi:hypothetical protein
MTVTEETGKKKSDSFHRQAQLGRLIGKFGTKIFQRNIRHVGFWSICSNWTCLASICRMVALVQKPMILA